MVRRLAVPSALLSAALLPRAAAADPSATTASAASTPAASAAPAAPAASAARADDAPLTPTVASDSFPFRPGGPMRLDGGLVLGFPTALPTGLSSGIGAGVSFGDGPFRVGARAAWTTATESTLAWTVTHDDLRLRITGTAQHTAGRGSLGLRAGAGGTLVHESRLRNQGARAGLEGDALRTSAWAMLPAAELEAVAALHVIGPWLLVLTGGPSVALVDGDSKASWTAQLGVGWQP